MGKTEFIMLPNKLFYAEEEGQSYIAECKDYSIITTIIWIYSNINFLYNYNKFTIEELLMFNDKVVRNENIKRMKSLLSYMINKGLMATDTDINKVKVNRSIRCTLNLFDKDEEGNDICFTKIPIKVIDKILSYNGKEDKIKLLFYWCYLHCRRYKKLSITDSKPSTTYVSYDKIVIDTKLSKETISKYNDVLVEMKLLLIENCGVLVDGNGEVKECNNIYVTIDKDIETAQYFVREGVNRYIYDMKGKGYKVIKKKANTEEEPTPITEEVEPIEDTVAEEPPTEDTIKKWIEELF